MMIKKLVKNDTSDSLLVRGIHMIKITEDNYFEIKAAMKKFLDEQIHKRINDAGGKRPLSAKLGKTHTYVEMALKRSAFSNLERLYKEILELEKKNSS